MIKWRPLNKNNLVVLIFVLLLSLLLSLTDGKTVTVTSYQTKYNYTKTSTYQPSPGTIIVYDSKTFATETSTSLKYSTSLLPPEDVSSVYSFVYKQSTIKTTSTSVINVTRSISSTYTVI